METQSNRLPAADANDRTFRVIMVDEPHAPGISIQAYLGSRTIYCCRQAPMRCLLDALEQIREQVPGFTLALPVGNELKEARNG